MTDRILLVQGDTRPRLVIDLADEATGDAMDVSDTGTSVVVKFRELGGQTLKATLACTKLITATNATPGAAGRVQALWPAGALDTAGSFEGEIEITFADGTVQTVYDRLRFKVREEF
jgi:hypothetical protein